MSVIGNVLLGRPLATEEEHGERVGPVRGLGILGLDALASAAYGPEALLTILLPLGTGALAHLTPITLLIVGLLLVVYLSYRQTIDAYPNGGGSYTVAKENLGPWPGLVAAAALSVDYVLNVAIAIAAGVGALVSVAPALLPFTLWLCLALLFVLVLVNIRGVRATGAAWLIPTYAFVGALVFVLALGAARALSTGGHPVPVVAPPRLTPAGEGVSIWLLARAFGNGCTALTGVEAVSNGVPIFHDPPTRGARRTLGGIIGVLVVLLIGIAFDCRAYAIGATPPGQPGYETVLAQLVAAIVGRGWLYGVTIGAVVAVLLLSANTSFADFPRVCRLLALDGFLPESFAYRGRRLAFSHGITVLGVVSGLMLAVFGGVTDALIPLFAFGAFLAFTMSQSGMVAHWQRRGGHPVKLFTNALGAVCTGCTCIIIVASKFTEGAWISVLLVLMTIAVLAGIRRHNDFVRQSTQTDAPLEVGPLGPPIAVVPMRRWNAVSVKALRFAVSFAREVIAIQILTGDRAVDDLTDRWASLVCAPARSQGKEPPRLVVIRSEYRRLLDPLREYVERLAHEHPDRQVAVIVAELMERRWYDFLVDTQTATVLREALLYRGGPQIVVISVPWYLPKLRGSAPT
ncbi:MAG: APC family permease [Polyangiaceae bacterium]|jgi:amino acid transporter